MRTSVFSMSDLSLMLASYLLWMMQDAEPHAGQVGDFLASHPSYTKPSSDSIGPLVRSKSSGLIPKESKNALEYMWSPFVVLFDQRKDSKGGLFL